ncbi:MAG: DUF6916 family protein [Jatrophihabitans sp.]|uniref:DUF6916 family protein n=1 Tax=Jatrophihabitans sp. TaxID=1932789 RepID=UPI003F7DCCDA
MSDEVEMTATTRRTFLAGGLGVVGLAVVGTSEGVADAATAPAPARRHYRASVGKVFVLRHGTHAYRARLTAIRNLPHAGTKHREQCFSLVFTSLRGHIPDGTYTVQRRGVRTHSLFVTGGGRSTHAIVNRAH